MGQLALAARKSDTVGCHIGGGSSGSGGRFLSSALKWAAIGALAAGAVVGAIIAAPVILAAAGASAAVVAAAGTVAAVGGGTAGLSLAVIGGALSGASGGIKVQREAEAKPSSGGGGGGCGNITSGSHNVNIENKPAARAQQDTNIHPPSSPKVAEGSSYVYVNGKPLARIDDKSCCGGKIISACSRTYIGGPPTNGGGADASPIAGASFSWSNMDSWNWEGIETGLGVAGLAMGVGMAGVAVRGVAIAQGGFKALVTTSAGRVAAGKLTAGIGAGVGGGMAMSAAGEHIGGTIGGAGAGAVAGALAAEALANAMPFGAAGKMIKGPKVRLGPANAAEASQVAGRMETLAQRRPDLAERAQHQADRHRAMEEGFKETGKRPTPKELDARVKARAEAKAKAASAGGAEPAGCSSCAGSKGQKNAPKAAAAAPAPKANQGASPENPDGWKKYVVRRKGFDPKGDGGKLYGTRADQAVRAELADARPKSLKERMDSLAAKRREMARELGEENPDSFGKTRDDIHPTAGKKFTQTTLADMHGKSERYGELSDRIAQTDPSFRGYDVTARIGDQDVALSSVNRYFIVHTPAENVPAVMNHVDPLFRDIEAGKYRGPELVEKVGEVHWWMAQAMPYDRGSAGVTDMATKYLFMKNGVEPPPYKPGVSPDLDAIIAKDPESFAKGYRDLFEPRGGQAAPPAAKPAEPKFDPEATLPPGTLAPTAARDGMVPQQSQQQQSAHQPSQAQRDLQAQQMAEQRARQDALRQGDGPQQQQQQQQQQAGPRPLEDAALPETGAQIPRRFDRFEANAGELAPENLVVTHGVNEDQLAGGTRAGHGGVRNLSNEDLVKYGGPNGDDPIVASRAYAEGDSMLGPGPRLIVRAGHHRVHEINRRVQAGLMPADTPVQMQVATGEKPIVASSQLCTTCGDAGAAPSASGQAAAAASGKLRAQAPADPLPFPVIDAPPPAAPRPAADLPTIVPSMLDAPVIPAAPPPPPPRPAFPPPPKPEGDRQHISVGQLEKWKGVKAAHPERYGKADALYPGDQTQGTCSLMVCGQLIEAQTGTRLTEADLMGRGVEAGVWTPEQGMSSLGAKQILHDAGVAAVDIPHDPPAPGRYVNWDPMDPSSLGPISHRQGVVQAIDEGYGVLSSHDAKKLYNDPRAGGGHAIMPVDVVRDAAGNVTHVVVNDTSGALGSTVPIRADLYFDSLSGAIRTETPIWGP